MKIQRHLLVLAAPAVLLCAACGGTSTANGDADGGANASCVAPYLDDQPPGGSFRSTRVPTVSPGSVLTVYGHWYTSTCNDTGGNEPLKPFPPVHLTLTLPGGLVRDLGELSPGGEDMGFSVDVHVPPAARAGTATVRDDQEHPAAYTFRVGR